MKQVLIALLTLTLVFSCGDPDEDFLVTITTEKGTMYAILYDETPRHKENFLKLASEGFYDSLLFHRVMQEFMIQGGDPNTKNLKPGLPAGNGGPGYTVDAEFRPEFIHKKGALAAARQPDNVNPDKASSGSQFYIVQGKQYSKEELVTDMNALNDGIGRLMRLEGYDSIGNVLMKCYQEQDWDAYTKHMLSLKTDVKEKLLMEVDKKNYPNERLEVYTTVGGTPGLDDEYTVFGEVVKGIEVVDAIAEVRTDQRNRPLENLIMKVTVEKMKKKKITKLTGYEFPVVEKK